MIVKRIDYANNIFITEDGSEYPIIFDMADSITIEEFQELINNSGELLEKITEAK